MGGFDGRKLSDGFGIPDDHTPMAMIAVGCPGDPDALPDKQRETELGERQRQALEEIAFAGRWATPYEE
jgi:hypothetical protein